MTDASKSSPTPEEHAVVRPEVVDADDPKRDAEPQVDETVDHPAKVMRIGTMMRQLLEEVRSADLDEASRDRLRQIYATSMTEIGSALSADLREELGRLASPFSGEGTPSVAELQIAKAQLVGWLEGLVQGMQAMLFAQQMAAQQQLASMRGQLPAPPPQPQSDAATPGDGEEEQTPGVYL